MFNIQEYGFTGNDTKHYSINTTTANYVYTSS